MKEDGLKIARSASWKSTALLPAFALVGVLAIGCGGGNAFEGSWVTTFAALRRVVSVRATFTSPSDLAIVQTLTADPSTTTNAGCVETRRSTGIRWQSNGSSQLTIDTTFASNTIERHECTNVADNHDPMPDTAPLPVLNDGLYTYAVANSTLTLTPAMGGTQLEFNRTN